MRPGILTLTTDFGIGGPYVAAMKGVLLGLAPGTQIVDVCHTIAPQNILEGAFVLAGIVDVVPRRDGPPGGGRSRGRHRPAPDRGLAGRPVVRPARQRPDHRRGPRPCRRTGSGRSPTRRSAGRSVSATFHGRDILAPAAAHLLLGGDPAELGPPVDRVRHAAELRARPPTTHGFVGEVIFRDTFGNLITNVERRAASRRHPAEDWTVEIAGERIEGLVRTYGEKPTGTLVALVGSSGWIEIAVVNGDAAPPSHGRRGNDGMVPSQGLRSRHDRHHPVRGTLGSSSRATLAVN